MESRIKYSPARNHQRFKAISRALVLINTGPESLPFHIMDISEGGLSFRYLGPKLRRSAVKAVSLYHDQELIVSDIPIKSISDYRLSDNLITVRRGSVQFDDMDPEKLGLVELFIRNYTEAPLPVT